MINYGFVRETDLPFEEALEIAAKALKKGGFGILTRIDVREKFKEKLGVDFSKYIILGACSPPSAHQAIIAEENIGLMLPCNVILYEKDGRTVISVIRPTVAMGMIDNERLKEIATEVEARLKEVFDSLEEGGSK